MEEQEKIDVKELQVKARAFVDLKSKVHLSFKRNYWKRGHIIQADSPDFFVFNDDVEGNLIIFYLELENIDQFREKKPGNAWRSL